MDGGKEDRLEGARPRNETFAGSGQTFSPLQWYLSHARNTVYFAAQSKCPMSEAKFHTLIETIMNWAPQLNMRAENENDRHVAIEINHKSICRFELTDNLETSLAETVSRHDAIYSDPALPDFRAFCFRLRQPQKGKPQTLVVCCTSHALMEGSETSRLMRARQSVHNADQEVATLGFIQRGTLAAAGLVLAPFHLAASRFNSKNPPSGKAVIVNIERDAVKKLAIDLNVRQRSVLFSLPLFGLQLAPGLPRHAKKRAHLVSYATLPESRTSLEDSALNLRMQVGRFPAAGHFSRHVRLTDAVLARENTREIYSQALYNSILNVHRVLQKPLPFLYRERFFTYVPYDFVLSLLPPHVSGGLLRGMFDGSVFCGSYTPGVNTCVFVPHRDGISLNLYLRPPVLENIAAFSGFLDDLGIGSRRII